MSVGECKANLAQIIDSIIHYYDKEKGWVLESNIPLDPIFDSYVLPILVNCSNDISPLVLIIRWVITTILFSAKKTDYITTILTLSPQTQVCLQCIIEAVMNSFPLDDADSTSFSEMHSLVEDSALSTEGVSVRRDSLDPASHADLHDHYEDEIDRLEKQIIALQQSLSNQREETEMLRRQRDELQREVIRMESELKEKREIIHGLEGQERRLSNAVENQSEELKEEIRSLKSLNGTMRVRRAAGA